MTSSIHQHANTKRSLRFGYALFGLLALFGAAPAHAFINDYDQVFHHLSLNPDLFAGGVEVNYDKDTKLLSLTSSDVNRYVNSDVNSPYSVTANMTLTVQFGSGNPTGYLDIQGTTTYNNISTSTVLLHSTNLIGFGSKNATDPFRFLFSSLSGALSTAYNGQAAIESTNLFTGFSDFANSFSSFLENVDISTPVAAVPEPGTVMLLVGGIAAMRLQRKRRAMS